MLRDGASENRAWRMRRHPLRATPSPTAAPTGERVRAASAGRSSRLRLHPTVAFFLELERERFVAGANQLAVRQDVHEIRHDVVEQTLVVRDHDDRALR